MGGFVGGSGCGGVKQGRFVILRFPVFCSVWGSQSKFWQGLLHWREVRAAKGPHFSRKPGRATGAQ